MKNQLFSQVIEKISPTEEEIRRVNQIVQEFRKKISKNLKGAKFFVGGSLAKSTVIKKNKGYDIDVFIMFKESKKEKKDLSLLLEKILKKLKLKYQTLKGSRNYFQIDFQGLRFEIVPILEIKKASEAKNITDISPLHVRYLLGCIKKNKKLAQEIKLAKAFCYAHDCYGAESYIQGFSGYALEVLVSYYGSFFKFIKEAIKWNQDSKVVIDPKKYYKNKNQILEQMNESKQTSPIILIDPVQKERNVCAALSKETLEKFILTCKEFTSNPKEEFFFKKEFNPDEFKNLAKKHGAEFIILKVRSSKNKPDIAGAKLKKFYDFLAYNLKKNNFTIINSYFDFDEKTFNSRYFFVIKEPPKEILVQGPPLTIDNKYKTAFREKWPGAFSKHNRLMALSPRKFSSFGELLKSISKEQVKSMGIKDIETTD